MTTVVKKSSQTGEEPRASWWRQRCRYLGRHWWDPPWRRSWCLSPRGGSWWFLLAPRGCWYPLVAHVGFLWRQWYSTATLLPLFYHFSATFLLLYCQPTATLLPLHRHPTATRLPLYCQSTATVLPLNSKLGPRHATEQQPGTTAAQIFPNLTYPSPGPTGPDAAPKTPKFPSHTLLVQRQPNTLEAVWEKEASKLQQHRHIVWPNIP